MIGKKQLRDYVSIIIIWKDAGCVRVCRPFWRYSLVEQQWEPWIVALAHALRNVVYATSRSSQTSK